MHESLMTSDDTDRLAADVEEFYTTYRGQPISERAAEEFFARRHGSLTRPIWITLEQWGCVVRPRNGFNAYHAPMRPEPWIYDAMLRSFRPAELPGI